MNWHLRPSKGAFRRLKYNPWAYLQFRIWLWRCERVIKKAMDGP